MELQKLMKNKSSIVKTLLEILSDIKQVPTTKNGSLNIEGFRKMPEVKAVITLLKAINADTDKFPVAQMLLGNIYSEGETGNCILCEKKYFHFGNNAEPLAEGRCCDNCNTKVVTARISGVDKYNNNEDQEKSYEA